MSQMIANGEKLALLRGAQRVWAISSVHGEAERLRALHEAISRQFQPGDRLVYLGNILGHGPDVTDAVDEVLAFRRAVISAHGMFAADVVVLRGAQEEMWQKLLQLQLALNSGEVFDWMMEQGVGATLKSYGGGCFRRPCCGACWCGYVCTVDGEPSGSNSRPFRTHATHVGVAACGGEPVPRRAATVALCQCRD